MKLEIDNDVAEKIVLSRLRDDYRMLIQDIINLQGYKELHQYQKDDLRHHRKYASALEIVLEYYDGTDWSERISNA